MCRRPLGKGCWSRALIGCFHVSGLFAAAVLLPLALIEIRRRGP